MLRHFVFLFVAVTALCSFVQSSLNAQGYSTTAPLFTVENVRIDVTADNALAARDQAFDRAQQKAFEVMAQRMLPTQEFEGFTMPETGVISGLVKDYEITNEKLSSIRYIGTYTFRFHENAVRRYFTKAQVQYTDLTSQPVLVLPFYRSAGKTILWSQDNPWFESWKKSGGGAELVPVIVPIGDLADVQDIGDQDMHNYNPYDLRQMLQRYGAKEAVIAVAEPQEQTIQVDIYRTDQMRPAFVKRVEVSSAASSLGQGPANATYMVAVQKVKEALQTDWKDKAAVRPQAQTQKRILSLRVPFSTLQEWTKARNALNRIPAVDRLEIKALTQNQARVDLHFHGSREHLVLAMQQAGMGIKLSNHRPAEYGNPSRYGRYDRQDTPDRMVVLYDLYFHQPEYVPSTPSSPHIYDRTQRGEETTFEPSHYMQQF